MIGGGEAVVGKWLCVLEGKLNGLLAALMNEWFVVGKIVLKVRSPCGCYVRISINREQFRSVARKHLGFETIQGLEL
jgi:hypothetical protein